VKSRLLIFRWKLLRFEMATLLAEAFAITHLDEASFNVLGFGPTRTLGMEVPLQIIFVLAINEDHFRIVLPNNFQSSDFLISRAGSGGAGKIRAGAERGEGNIQVRRLVLGGGPAESASDEPSQTRSNGGMTNRCSSLPPAANLSKEYRGAIGLKST